MRKYLLALLSLALAVPAAASCTYSSGAMRLSKIRLGDPGNVWVGCVNDSMDLLSNAAASTTTAAAIAASTTTLGNRATALETALSTMSAVLYTMGQSTFSAPGTGACTLPQVVGALNVHGAPTCTQPTNVTGTAMALAASGSPAPSGYVCRGVDAAGNCLPAYVDSTATGISGSTAPASSGALFSGLATKAPLTGTGTNGTWPINVLGNAASASTAPWSGLQNFPAGCILPNVVTAIGASLTCTEPSDVTGNAATASALALAGSSAGSGFLSRGVDASGNALPAFVETNSAGISGSTNPWSAGAAYVGLSGKQAAGIYSGVGSCTLPNVVTALNNGGAPTCSQPSDVTGNAASVSNGVYTTGTYSDPAWILSLATSKVDLSTVTLALATKASTGTDNSLTRMLGGGAAIDLPNGVSGSSASFTNGVTASSGTFTAAGPTQFSISASSGIKIGACMTFGDSSVQCSAAGTGGATGGGTNGYSARWTGSSALGNGSFSDTGSSATVINTLTVPINSTITVTGTANFYAVSTTTYFGAVSSTTFYGLDLVNYNYVFDVTLYDGSNSGFFFRCNDDAGNNYADGGFDASGAGSASYGNNPAAEIYLQYRSATRTLANNGISIDFTLKRDSANSNSAIVNGQSGYKNDSSSWSTDYYSGRYLGASAVTKCSIVAASGTITGTVKLQRIQR